MSAIVRCPSCRAATPSSVDCVHCGAKLSGTRRLVKGAFAIVGASIASMTLMACYGMPPCDTNAHLADGGENPEACGFDDHSQADGGTDGGVTTDGGVDGGP